LLRLRGGTKEKEADALHKRDLIVGVEVNLFHLLTDGDDGHGLITALEKEVELNLVQLDATAAVAVPAVGVRHELGGEVEDLFW